ncbi:Aspartyl/asparaginyl beta-hydroxylase [Trichinella patagoniensis]|uniref:Aspartyl/asparaginyl beta-hydroxylase n=1 Tax=Trichinella patagoniensis TaxID=990121 RepID=A0A0V0ZMS4_9BILA|nr:Aspartyl/asparaginyl beta-hydroxylase [Trichinella patagoniensis]
MLLRQFNVLTRHEQLKAWKGKTNIADRPYMMRTTANRLDYSITDGGLKYCASIAVFVGLILSLLTMLPSSQFKRTDSLKINDEKWNENEKSEKESLRSEEEALRLKQLGEMVRLRQQRVAKRRISKEDQENGFEENSNKQQQQQQQQQKEKMDFTSESDEPKPTLQQQPHFSSPVRTFRTKGKEHMKASTVYPSHGGGDEDENSDYDDENEGNQIAEPKQTKLKNSRQIRVFRTKNGQITEKPSIIHEHVQIPISNGQNLGKIRVYRTRGHHTASKIISQQSDETKFLNDDDDNDNDNDKDDYDDDDDNNNDDDDADDKDSIDSGKEHEEIEETKIYDQMPKQTATVRYIRIKNGIASKITQPLLHTETESGHHQLSIRYRRIKGKDQTDGQMEEWKILVPKVTLNYNTNSLISTNANNQMVPFKITLLPETHEISEDRSAHLPQLKYTVTNQLDQRIRLRLDIADRLLSERRLEESLYEFDDLLKVYPTSPRSRYGKAVSLDLLADHRQSNQYLEKAIDAYESVIPINNLQVLQLPQLPDELLQLTVHRLVERCRFRAYKDIYIYIFKYNKHLKWFDKAVQAQIRLLEKQPNDANWLNEFAITMMMMGRFEDAKRVFLSVLDKDMGNAVALLYYGYILKTVDRDYAKSIHFLSRGLAIGVQLKQAARFVLHLGEALQRLNKTDEAYSLYEEAARNRIFLSKYQRSLYNVVGITARPWWTVGQTICGKQLKNLEKNWRQIKEQVMHVWNTVGREFDRVESYTETGDWKQMNLFTSSGRKYTKNCEHAEALCNMMEQLSEDSDCKVEQIYLISLVAGTHIWPRCAFANYYLTAYMGVALPHGSWIRVHNESRPLILGRFAVFDPSFEHELHAGGSGFQLLLAMNIWHPELSEEQRQSVPPL